MGSRLGRAIGCGALLCAVAAAYVEANSGGAGTCTVTDPAIAASAHGPVSAGNGGFALSVPHSYNPDGATIIRLTSTSNAAFKGILIYATDSGSNRVGSWTIAAGYAAKLCIGATNSTLTQSSNTAKSTPAAFTWTAPPELTGQVTFQVLVVSSLISYFNISGATMEEAVFVSGFE